MKWWKDIWAEKGKPYYYLKDKNTGETSVHYDLTTKQALCMFGLVFGCFLIAIPCGMALGHLIVSFLI